MAAARSVFLNFIESPIIRHRRYVIVIGCLIILKFRQGVYGETDVITCCCGILSFIRMKYVAGNLIGIFR